MKPDMKFFKQKLIFSHSQMIRIAVILLVVAVLVGIIVSGGYFSNSRFEKNNPVQSRYTFMEPGSAVLVLGAAQSPGVISIKKVEIPQPGFVVVQDDMYGSPGIVVGVSSYLNVGRTEDILVELARAFAGDEQFYVSVRADNGDGRFKQLDDPALTNESGTPILIPVTAQGSGTVDTGIALPADIQRE